MTLYRRLCYLLLALYLLSGFTEARAATAYTLTFYVFATDKGHTGLPSSYLMTIPVGTFASRAECEAQGNKSQSQVRSSPLPDGARLIPYFTCETEVTNGKP